MTTQALVLGDQVMVNPLISGPAAGRIGYVGSQVLHGKCQVLDRPPDQPNGQLLGFHDPEDLFPMKSREAAEVWLSPQESALVSRALLAVGYSRWRRLFGGSPPRRQLRELAMEIQAVLTDQGPSAAGVNNER